MERRNYLLHDGFISARTCQEKLVFNGTCSAAIKIFIVTFI
jgi:hypothetical protein